MDLLSDVVSAGRLAGVSVTGGLTEPNEPGELGLVTKMAASPSARLICDKDVALPTVPLKSALRKYQLPVGDAGRLTVVALDCEPGVCARLSVNPLPEPPVTVTGPLGNTE